MTKGSLAADTVTAAGFAALALLVCGYFFFAATKGPYGLYEKGRIEVAEITKTRTLQSLIAKREHAQNLALRMSDDYLDLDLLDEQARAILGMMRDDEIIIR